MTGVGVYVQTARAELRCVICDALWRSQSYNPTGFGEEVKMAAPALADGWRVYVAGRGQRVYCPEHAPTVPMRLLYGAEPTEQVSTKGDTQ